RSGHRRGQIRLLPGIKQMEQGPMNWKTGGCHCGMVRFAVLAPDVIEVKECNCSICGIKSFYVPRSKPDGFSVNVRCLDDGQVTISRVTLFDGQHWEEQMAALAEAEGHPS